MQSQQARAEAAKAALSSWQEAFEAGSVTVRKNGGEVLSMDSSAELVHPNGRVIPFAYPKNASDAVIQRRARAAYEAMRARWLKVSEAASA